MKAIVQDVYGDTEVLSVADVPEPTPGPDEVLVRVHAAGVDPGVWHFMTGLPMLVRPVLGFRGPKIKVRGREVAGRVVSVGANVTELRPGDAVFGTSSTGTYAELARVPVKRCVPKPANLTFEQAAALAVSGLTALDATRDVVKAGQKVLVIGAGGGVGGYVVQLARSMGAEVTGVCSGKKADLVRSLGATHVIDYTTTDFADGTRYDVVVDIAGLRRLSHLRRALAERGTLVIVGGEGGGRWLGGMERNLGAMLLSLFTRQRLTAVISRETKAGMAHLAELAGAGELTPAVDRTFPLEQAPEAIRYLMDGHARGKVVISVLAGD